MTTPQTPRTGTGKYRGVTFNPGRPRPWSAVLRHAGRRLFGGYHATAETAARHYDRLARQMHGLDALLNFPDRAKGERKAIAGKRPGDASSIVGVCWDSRDDCWRAVITFAGRRHHVGYFRSAAAAGRAIAAARRALHQGQSAAWNSIRIAGHPAAPSSGSTAPLASAVRVRARASVPSARARPHRTDTH